MVQQNNNKEMTDDELITLLGDYGFEPKEISKLLREIKTRDPESVIEKIEAIQKEREAGEIQEVREQQESAKNKQQEIEEENERNKKYKERIMEKIRANKEERLRKEKLELEQEGVVEEKTVPAELESPVRVRAMIDWTQDVYLGFEESSTVSELFAKLREVTKVSSIKVSPFGDPKPVDESSDTIKNVFGANAVMLSVGTTSSSN